MHPILEKIGYTKADEGVGMGEDADSGHCDLIWFFFFFIFFIWKQHILSCLMIGVVIKRKPFIPTQSAYIHFPSRRGLSPPLPATRSSHPWNSSWRCWFGFVSVDGGSSSPRSLHRYPQTPVLASSPAWRASETPCPSPRSVCTPLPSLPRWKTSLFSFFANVCGRGINMLCAKWITAN